MDKKDERRFCEHCGRELLTGEMKYACHFYWLLDTLIRRISPKTFYEFRWLPPFTDGVGQCQGWGCKGCMVEINGVWFHRECPKTMEV